MGRIPKPKIAAWHASPHDFSKFDFSNIGGGEGVQAKGHGLYFAGRRPTAEWYLDKFNENAGDHPPVLVGGNDPSLVQGGYFANTARGDAIEELEKAAGLLKSDVNHDPLKLRELLFRGLADQDARSIERLLREPPTARRHIAEDRIREAMAARDLELRKLFAQGVEIPENPARLYKVNIDADPESMLDYDKPMSAQSPVVQQALEELGFPLHRESGKPNKYKMEKTGANAYWNVAEKMHGPRQDPVVDPGPEFVATELQAKGVPGIRYLDGTSRRRGAGSHNYVMFPGTEDLIRIVNKFGFIPPALYAAMQASESSAAEPQGFQQNPDDPTKFFVPQGVDATPAADPSVERAIIPTEPFPDYAAEERKRVQQAYGLANQSFESSTMYGETARARAEQLTQAGVDPSVAEMRALQEMEFQRPTISAQYYKSAVGDWPVDANGEVPDFVSPAALAKGMSVSISVMNAMNGGGAFTPEQVYDAISKVATNNPEQLDKQLAAVGAQGRDVLLDAMNAHAPEGEWSDTSGVTDEEFSGLQKKYGMNANFMYPDRLRANFDALRQYELFAAGTPRYEPGRSVMQIAGDVLYADRQSADFKGSAPAAPSYVSQFWTPQPTWDARNAVYWYRQSQPSQPSFSGLYVDYDSAAKKEGYHFFRDPRDNSARYYRHSTLYPTGSERGTTEDTSRLHPRLSAYTLPYTQTPLTGDKGYITDVNLRTKRPVPIRPAHWKPEDVLSNQQAVQNYEQASNDYTQASAAGYLGKNPTPFATGMLNLPRWMGDASTIADVAISGGIGGMAGAMSKAPIRGAIRGAVAPAVGEAMSQVGYTTGLGTAVTPSTTDYLFRSAPNNTLQEVDPAHPRYWQKFRKKWEGEVDALDNAAKAEQARRSMFQSGQ